MPRSAQAGRKSAGPKPVERAPPVAPSASDSRPAAIEARGLTKRYHGERAVDRLSFRVPPGSITGFVGPNGSGKTTTIRMLLHLAKPDAGTARVLGKDIRFPRGYLRDVGSLIEAPAFHPGLSGEKNLRNLARLGRNHPSRVNAVLHQVGLGGAGNKPYKAYSLGMKQRLGIAAAILSDPRLLILDEPTNGLDPFGIREIRDLLQRLAGTGRTILVSSHLLDEVQRMCDHLILIREGRLVYQGRVDDLLTHSHARSLEDTVLEMTGAGQA